MTPPNKEGRVIGVTDEGLTEEGVREVEQLGEHLKKTRRGPQVIYSGPMRRHLQTAGGLANAFGVNFEVQEGLREANYGKYEGARLEVLRGIQYGYDAGAMKKAGGETPQEIEERVAPVIKNVLRVRSNSVAIVTSALTACIITQILMGEGRVLSTAKPLSTGDFHSIQLGRDGDGRTVVFSFEPNVLKPPLKV